MKSLYFFTLFVLLFGCKKHEPDSPSTSLETPVLRKADVKGAKQVLIDQQNKIIQIVLPESFTSEFIKIELDLVKGVNVGSEGSFTVFNFKGADPLVLNINNNISSAIFPYKIFVDLEGEMDAKLASDLVVSQDGSCLADVEFIRGVGTIPERPEGYGKMIAYLNDQAFPSAVIQSSAEIIFNFSDAYKLLSAKNVGLTIQYADQQVVLPGELHLTRFPLQASFNKLSPWWNIIPKGAEVEINGGCFLQDRKYTVRLRNDAVGEDLSVNAEYIGAQKLKFIIPPSNSDGNYYISVYEEGLRISDAIYTISNTGSQKGIQQIWKDHKLNVTSVVLDPGDFQKIIASAGQEIFVNPYPMMTGPYKGKEVPEEVLPVLKISGNGEVYELAPKKMIDDTFGDNALVLYYGAYTLPLDIKAGSYKTTLKYKGWGETTPFCKLLQVQ